MPPCPEEAEDRAARLAGDLLAALRDGAPPNVGLMRLLIEAADENEVGAALADAHRTALGPAVRLTEAAADLWRGNPGSFATTKAVLARVSHDRAPSDNPAAGVAGFAAAFDGAARTAPDGGAALYALGSPELLRAATQEIVEHLRVLGVLRPGCAVLDLGCGPGRLVEPLAAEVGLVVGCDISIAMLAAARRRCAARTNAGFVRTSGLDLSSFRSDAFDLVLAVDSFPYLVQAGSGLAEAHVRDAARVLKPRGHLAIFNYSYRGQDAADRADLEAVARANGLTMVRVGERPFTLWDGLAFHMVKGR